MQQYIFFYIVLKIEEHHNMISSFTLLFSEEYWDIDDFVDNSIDTGNRYSKSDFEEIINTYYIICKVTLAVNFGNKGLILYFHITIL